MDSLQQSDMWSAGARLTQLFDWSAIGAVLIFLTLLQAVWLAATSSRRFEAQQIVVLKYIRAQLTSLSIVEKISVGALKSGVPLHELSSLPMIMELERSFSRIDPMSLPTSASMEAVERSRSALLTLKGLYDPDAEDRKLLQALLPFTADYTTYAIACIEREIEDRHPVLLFRLFRQIVRGSSPSQPETFLGQAVRKAEASSVAGER